MIETLYPQFRYWSARGGVFLISDTHFDDPDRPLMSYSINEEEQINKIKQKVGKCDTLIHLGDVGNPEYLNELKCYKVLIMGNHDESVKKFQLYFDEIYSGPLWVAEKLILSHEPLDVYMRNSQNPIAFNIHGHNHSGAIYSDSFHFNIAQNVYGYNPVNLKVWIKVGYLRSIKGIHRETIDLASNKEN